MTRIAVVNCNTTEAMTEAIAAQARRAASAGTTILGVTPSWGVPSAEGWYDSFVSAAAVLDAIEGLPDDIDGIVMAGFGEHGREGAREVAAVPVIDITEAAVHAAMPLGRRYGIVTTLDRTAGLIEDSLLTAGLLAHSAGVVGTGLGVLELESDPDRTAAAFVDAARRLIDRGAEVICLGCAGMAGLEQSVRAALEVPVVDGVAAAVASVETLSRLGLRTSRVGSYARPLPKRRSIGRDPAQG